MLRTTISTIRKVCSLGCVPRVLRDDFRNGPASYAAIRKAHKSTKSTDLGPNQTENGTDFPILKTTSPDTKTGIPLTHREKCQKIIEQAFGTSSAEPVMEQYCSHTVNIEATRREMEEAEKERERLQEQNLKEESPMVPDDRQYGIFKMSRELIKVDELESMVEENTQKKAPPTDTLTKEETAHGTIAFNEDLVKMIDVGSTKKPHLETDSYLTFQVVNAPLREPKLEFDKEDSDTAGNKAELCDDADAKNVSAANSLKYVIRNPAENRYHKRVLNVTTAQEQDEKLAQKLETIEETPLVEAQKPGIEGFNVNPKVLGDQLNPTLTCKSIHKKQDLPGTYDEVAERCLNHPLGQIDEMLVKEMEQMGLPTCDLGKKTPSTLMGDEQFVQMDLCNENKQQEHQEMYSKSAELDNDEMKGNIFMTPPTCHLFSQVRLPDLNEEAEEKTLLKFNDIEPGENEDSVPKHPNPDQMNEIKPVACDNNPTVKISCSQKSELDEEDIERDHYISPSQLIHTSQTIQEDMNPTIQNHNPTAILSGSRPSKLDEEDIERDHYISLSQLIHTSQTIEKDMNPTIQKHNPTAKLSGSRTSELDEDKEEIGKYHDISPSQLFHMNQTIDKDMNPGYSQPNVQLPAPNVITPTDKESMEGLHSSIFKQLTGRHDQNVDVKNTEAKTRSPDTAEGVKSTINHPTDVSLYHPVGVCTCNMEDRRLTHCGTINASHLAENDQGQLSENIIQNKNSHSHYLASNYACGHDEEPSATKVENELYVHESQELECHSRTPTFQPITLAFQAETMEEQAVLEEGEAANRFIVQPKTMEKQAVENLEPEKVTLPEELMKEHELDPYYVLTCNETCPISPVTSSACKTTDFVDTSDTIYMKKNICESIRPNIRRENLIVPFEKVMAQRPEGDVKSVMLQYENLTSDVKPQINDEINMSQSAQPQPDGTHLVTPQSENVPADTQAELHKISEIESITKNTPKIANFKNIKRMASPLNPSMSGNDSITLTELLKRVRENGRAQCTSDLGVKVDPATGTCKKGPRCQPTAPRSPPANPIPPPTFGLPMVKRRPEVCAPKKKGGCSKKCAACDMDVICGVQLGRICPEMVCELDEGEACNAISRVDLTDVILHQMQMLGKMVIVVLQQVKSNVRTLLAREYGPWAPIPSWPHPKKAENPCDKPCGNWTPGIRGAPPCVRGCPIFPKSRASMAPDTPCDLETCKGFPKRRSFSALNCVAVSLEMNEEYDLGQI